MTQREIAQRIYLSGLKPRYRVWLSGYAGEPDIFVASTRTGNAIVRALRALATERPDLFSAEG